MRLLRLVIWMRLGVLETVVPQGNTWKMIPVANLTPGLNGTKTLGEDKQLTTGTAAGSGMTRWAGIALGMMETMDAGELSMWPSLKRPPLLMMGDGMGLRGEIQARLAVRGRRPLVRPKGRDRVKRWSCLSSTVKVMNKNLDDPRDRMWEKCTCGWGAHAWQKGSDLWLSTRIWLEEPGLRLKNSVWTDFMRKAALTTSSTGFGSDSWRLRSQKWRQSWQSCSDVAAKGLTNQCVSPTWSTSASWCIYVSWSANSRHLSRPGCTLISCGWQKVTRWAFWAVSTTGMTWSSYNKPLFYMIDLRGGQAMHGRKVVNRSPGGNAKAQFISHNMMMKMAKTLMLGVVMTLKRTSARTRTWWLKRLPRTTMMLSWPTRTQSPSTARQSKVVGMTATSWRSGQRRDFGQPKPGVSAQCARGRGTGIETQSVRWEAKLMLVEVALRMASLMGRQRVFSFVRWLKSSWPRLPAWAQRESCMRLQTRHVQERWPGMIGLKSTATLPRPMASLWRLWRSQKSFVLEPRECMKAPSVSGQSAQFKGRSLRWRLPS